MENTNNPVIKPDRKTRERNRRIQMKGVIHELTSLVPPQHFKPSKNMLDQIDQVAGYIKIMREKVDKLEKKNEELIMITGTAGNSSNSASVITRSHETDPVVKVRDVGSSLEVVIISGKDRKLALHEIVRVVEEGGAEVISATTATVGVHVHQILHAKVKVLRIGVDSSLICDRIQALISGFTSK